MHATVVKPLGGFVFISVRQLCRVWVAYQHRQIRMVDLWVWFAAQELVARRCQVKPGQAVHYREEELTRLVSGTHSMSVSLRRLTNAGLLHWEESTLTFFDDRSALSDAEALTTMLKQVPNRDRRIPVPRRLIRYLAGGCHKVMVATIVGHLMRCLYYRTGHCRPEGHCKATWIARMFGVSLRQVKHARHLLEEIGLLQRSATVQWVMNRYGPTITINLQWEGPRHDTQSRAGKPAEEHLADISSKGCEPSSCAAAQQVPQPLAEASCATLQTPPPDTVSDPLSPIEIAPLTGPEHAAITPPDSYKELSLRAENQKPACGSPPGVLTTLFAAARTAVREGKVPRTEAAPVVVRSVSAQDHQVPSVPVPQPASGTLVGEVEEGPVEAPLPVPTLRHILAQDLRDTARLLQLYEHAVRAGLIGPSEADRLAFVALAQHVLSYRPDNAGGLFTQLLRKRHFDYVTQDDEDSAQRRLKRVLYGSAPPVLPPVVETALRRAG